MMAVVAATPSLRAEDACRWEPNGRVSCSADGFKVLTDQLVQHKARADKCELRLVENLKSLDENLAMLRSCQAVLADVKPCPPPKSPLLPMLGLGAGVLGSMLVVGGVVADVPASARFPMLLIGVAGIGGGAVLVWP